MEIILTENVKDLGLEGETVDVADGYARNYLIPQKKAVRATQGNVERFKRRKERLEQERREREERARALAEELEGVELVITESASDEGNLYGSVNQEDLADALHEAGHEDVASSDIIIDDPIRETGEHTVRVSLAGSVSVEVNVEVVPE